MDFIIKTPYQVVNKAYRRQKIEKTDFDVFRYQLDVLLSRVDETESEEHLKNPLRDFLKHTAFAENEINTKARTDLVVHADKSNKSPVAIIFETKKPGSREFPDYKKPESLNCKALHETILYYLRERIENNNNEIKQIIITNIYEWFVFDAHDFERQFFVANQGHASLREEYKKWKTGQKASTSTDLFYNEIVKSYIENTDTTLPCAYFDIRHIEEKRYTALFKFLSATHLLKLPFQNDSNTLDNAFYNELLHIVGLEEYNRNGQKIIDRQQEAKRQFGTLLENTYIILRYENRIKNVQNIEQYGDDPETQLINIALELSITWINRILFLKLLEAQLLKYHQNEPEYKFLTYENLPNFDELNKLFFRVLAKQTHKRNGVVSPKFRNIPYLNSSLFEVTPLEDQTIRISALDSLLTLTPYKQTVVQDRNGKPLNKPVKFLEYFFRFLDAYDFSSEGVEEVQEKSKTLINASVLGLIFEKINGYQDGSFFTPGFVTMYMSREVIRCALIQKFNEKYNWQAETFDDLKNFISNRQRTADILEFNQVVNSLKICDPAVGSGHFLVSALNEMIAAKSDIGILADEKGVKLSGYTAHVENDELVLSYNHEQDLFVYQLYNGKISKEQQRIQKTMFHEKQTIIENCLFGVDINQNSVNICRLRLWIELLKNAYYRPLAEKHDSTSLQLETLPNIDINIKQGNSLLNRFDIDADLSKSLRSLNYTFDTYKGFVNDYKNATDKAHKEGIVKIIGRIKENFKTEISKNDPRRKKLNRLTAELLDLTNPRLQFAEKKDAEIKKKEKQKIAGFENQINELSVEIEQTEKIFFLQKAFEWRFEFPEALDENGNFTGFDIVMGNPPYGIKLSDYEKDIYTKQYNYQDYKLDTYMLFIEKTMQLAKSNGYVSLIVPNTWLLNLKTQKIRKLLLEQTNFQSIKQYEKPVFRHAVVDTQIISFQKTSKTNEEQQIRITIQKRNGEITENFIKQKDWSLSSFSPKNIYINKQTIEIEKQIDKNLLLGEFAIITQGTKPFQVGKGKPTQTQDIVAQKPYVKKTKENKTFRPLLRGSMINRYTINWNKNYYISYGDWLAEPRYSGNFDAPEKLLIRQTGSAIVATYDDKQFIARDNLYTLILKNDEVDIKYILGILNSQLITWYYQNIINYEKGEALAQVKKGHLEQLPVVISTKKLQNKLIKKVKEIEEMKKAGKNTDKIASEIDNIVFKIYGLTTDEIKQITNE